MNETTNMDIGNKTNIIQKLKEEFPGKLADPKHLKYNETDFSKWLLSDLKRFLVVTDKFKGHSKAKKSNLVEIATKTWIEICSHSYFSGDDVNDDILSETSCLSTPPQSPFSCSSVSMLSPLSSPSSSTTTISSPPVTPKQLQKYPNISEGMTLNDFEKWTLSQLQDYLADRCINKSGNKSKLVQNVYGSYLLNLPVSYSDPQQEKLQRDEDSKQKLILDDGMVSLPNPTTLKHDWIEAPSNLPDTIHSQIEKYLTEHDAGKAFKGGKSLLQSNHLFNIMVHMISPNVRYCFVQGLCHPEQKLSKAPYTVWVCLQKDTGEVMTGECACIAGVSGVCKHVGAILWYVEEQVRLGNNKTCTSKKQKWSVPSKKQQALHNPDTLNNIGISKPKADRILSPSEPKKAKYRHDPRPIGNRKVNPLTENDIDTLADITNGNCGIVGLMRKPRTLFENFHLPSSYETVETTEHIELPKPIQHYANVTEFKPFLGCINVSVDQRDAVQAATSKQSESDEWFQYRKDRITASKLKECIQKVNDSGEIINPDKTRSILSKICGYYPKFESKATSWGISNEPIARRNYIKKIKSAHKNLVVQEPGFFIDLNLPFIGASPDGLINCLCHEPGVLEIKCPWTSRNLTIAEYAKTNQSCLEINSENQLELKRNHPYYYQVQCQMMCTGRMWCDFFLCTVKDSFLEKIA